MREVSNRDAFENARRMENPRISHMVRHQTEVSESEGNIISQLRRPGNSSLREVGFFV